MTSSMVLFGAAGVVVAAGVVGLVTALLGGGAPRPVRRPGSGRSVSPVLLAALAAAVLVLLVTAWPVAALGAGLAVWFVPKVLGGAKASERAIARGEAVAGWTRRLGDLLGSGAVGSLDGALRRSVSSCPPAIAPQVTNLVARIGPQGMETALRRFADEVDDPSAERVAAAMILRSRHGGRGLPEVLTGLATDLEERVRMVREIEAERAKPRSNTRTIIVLVVALIAMMMLFAREFLSPYSTVVGQVALFAVLSVFAVALRWLRRLSEPVRPAKFLLDPVTSQGA